MKTAQEQKNHDKSIEQARFYLTGVHCSNCAKDLIDGVLLKKEGIEEALYLEKSSLLKIAYKKERFSKDKIKKLITDIGYGVSENAEDIEAGKNNPWLRIVVFLIVFAILILLITLSKNL